MRWYQPFLYLWVAPASLLGLSLVPIAWLQGGKVAVVEGIVEVHGGIITWFLNRGLPWAGPAAAMTLGHVVWGADQHCLDSSRAHERVHVDQYERWGPLMLPLYLGYSLVLAIRGFDPYFDNPFEQEAYERAP